jgi:hypothetical protein
VALGTEWGLADFVGWGDCCSGHKADMSSNFINTFHGATAESYKVLVAPASDVFRTAGFDTIDFFSLDVEGAELRVLQGIDFARTRIRMMLIEVMQNNATSVQQIENLLALHGLQRDKTFESINGMNALFVNTRLSEPWMNATL